MPVTYTTYLKIEELLSLQQPLSDGPEHDETESRHEEVNVIVRGSGVYRVDGNEVAVNEGTVCRFDPETTRQLVAGPDGITMIAVGAPSEPVDTT